MSGTCIGTASFAITVNDNPDVTTTPLTSCESGSSGQATFTLNSGVTDADGGTLSFYTDAAMANLISDENAVLAGVQYTTGTRTIYVKSVSGTCIGTASFAITVNANPACDITGNQTVCTGLSSTFIATAGMKSYSWIGPGGFIANTPSITVSVAGTYYLTITNSSDCTSTCSRELIVQGCGKACTPGFWKTHPDVWDRQSDFVVNNMPGTLTNPVTPGGTFITTTNFNTYFALTNDHKGFYAKSNLTMLDATALGGNKDCQALVRHGVSALLGAAAFPTEYPFPAGSTDFASLYTLIRNALESGNCDALAVTLANINNLDGPFCSALSQLAQAAALEDTVFSSKTTSTMSDVGFDAYPVPFKDQLTIKYDFDYVSDVKIEVFNSKGRLVYSQTDTNSYLGKEITLNMNFKNEQEQVYIVKLTTDRGSSTKTVMSTPK